LKEFDISNTERLYKIINAYLYAVIDIARDNNLDIDVLITKSTLFKIFIAHSRAVIAMISDKNSDDILKISEYKKYLNRSLPGSFKEILDSKSYLKSAEMLDKKLLRRNFTI
jgi:hypothetical protein